MEFSKCIVCGKIITEEEWFDFSNMCEECALKNEIEKDQTKTINKRCGIPKKRVTEEDGERLK